MALQPGGRRRWARLNMATARAPAAPTRIGAAGLWILTDAAHWHAAH